MKQVVFVMMLGLMLVQSTMGQKKLEIVVSDLISDNGKVKLELRNNLDSVVHSFDLTIEHKVSRVKLDLLPLGTYFINYFHDANNNKKFDTNFLGMPQEGYGFSNNPEAKFGPPPMEKLLFKVSSDTTIVLKTYYW
ncbi:MAG: DUF2141 domain-containing protein [Salinivirgaceae bacterium]|nr:DUF2141 domain-containing protein [Salinivirgaceae bacterium]